MMWDNMQMMCESYRPGIGEASEEQNRRVEARRQKFEEQMLAITDRMMDKAMQGKPCEDEQRKIEEAVRDHDPDGLGNALLRRSCRRMRS